MFGLGSKNAGVDLGAANTLVHIEGKGIVLREPSAVAKNARTGEAITVGLEAEEIVGRTPNSIVAIRPTKDGVIANYDVAVIMLKYFVEETVGNPEPATMICTPSGITEVKERAVIDVTRVADVREAYAVGEPFAATIGAGLPAMDPTGSVVADIGGGAADAATISLGGIVPSRSTRAAGDKFNNAVTAYIHQNYNLLIGERTTETIKIQTASASIEKAKEIEPIDIRGRDPVTGLPKSVDIDAKGVARVIQEVVQNIIVAVKETLEETSPEIAADITDHGVALTGGGAFLRNLPEVISDATRVSILIAQDPLDCVAIGTGEPLKNTEVIRERR